MSERGPVVPSPPPASPRARRKRLGEMLVDQGVITRDQLDDVLARQKIEKGSRMGRLLVDLGHATEAQICEVIAEQLRIPAADMVAVDVPNEVLSLVTRELAMKHVCLPWFVEGRDLYLIMGDPTNVTAADAIAFHTSLKVKPVVAPESEVVAALERFYPAEEESLAQFDNLDLADQLSVVSDQEVEGTGEEDLEAGPLGAPLVKLVNAILADAIRAGASDIHIEPQQKGVEPPSPSRDLILTDMQMPGLDGLELLRKLRRDLATCQIPVIFLTVVESLDAEAKALDLGADDYLSKPVESARLVSRIRRALLRAHLRGAGR